MLFVIIAVVACFRITFGTKVPVCKAVNVSGAVISEDENWNPITIVYTYNFKIKITFDKENKTYPNVISVSDYEDWSTNSSLYFRTSPLNFVYAYNSEFGSSGVNCDYFNETCIVSIPNGQITSFFSFNYYNVTFSVGESNPMVLSDGTILSGQGYFMDENNSCVNGTGVAFNWRTSNGSICCTEFDYVEIPDKNENICEQFQSTTSIIDDEKNINLDLHITYFVKKVDSNTNITLYVFIDTVREINYTYRFYASNTILCDGNSSMLLLNCGYIIYGTNDLLWNFMYSFYIQGGQNYNGIILGEIIRRNGNFYKSNYKPYTTDDRCITKSSGVPFETAAYNTTFCCTKFKQDPVSTPSTTTATTTTVPLTTTTLKPAIDPQSNAIGLPCSNDTTKAWLDIAFVIDTSQAMSKTALKQLAAEISTYMQDFTFAQIGDHTVRAAIIGYASNVTTYYNLTDTTNYDDFVDALFNLADSDDSGGNVQGALQQAYKLLTSQSSQRKQLIVLIAAAYNSEGFQGADLTASIIKQNGICIVVINFESSQGVLSTALQNISCPGYYYISKDSDLNVKFPYALTQLNCICPPGSLQFREYNIAWKNYTNYGDCLLGFGTATNPNIAERVCYPGVLAAVTSQSKLDFITDQILPYAMPNKKKFTIGLHRSSTNEEWKWWGYNGTEYPLGNFPSMLNTPAPNDNWGYMWNHYGFNWTLLTGYNTQLPYVCQLRACDAEYICDQTQAKNIMEKFVAVKSL
jgi:hypothetical protein